MKEDKLFIIGKFEDEDPVEVRKNFIGAELKFREQGYVVMTPKPILDFIGFEHHDMMRLCFTMIDICDKVHVLENSQGKEVLEQIDYANQWHKKFI